MRTHVSCGLRAVGACATGSLGTTTAVRAAQGSACLPRLALTLPHTPRPATRQLAFALLWEEGCIEHPLHTRHVLAPGMGSLDHT